MQTLLALSSQTSDGFVLPNYYITSPGLHARTVASTRSYVDDETKLEILPHSTTDWDRAELLLQSAEDRTVRSTASRVFQANARGDGSMPAEAPMTYSVVPTPESIRIPEQGGMLDLTQGIHIVAPALSEPSISMLQHRLQALGVPHVLGGIRIDAQIDQAWNGKPEGYQLDVRLTGIRIKAGDAQGLFYGLQTIVGLMTPGGTEIPLVSIDDAPRYPFRGMHLDIARNFLDKAYVLSLIEQMSAYKLNRLHLHLADDEGWRLEIESLPELTQVGSVRCHDESEQRCLLPTFGSGPEPDSQVNGYLSVTDYLEILAFASAAQVQVIPSFDMPGHSRAAVKAMEARYHRLKKQGEDREAVRYLLSDLKDKTKYRSIQNYTDNTINVCMESSFSFVGEVLDQVVRLHEMANHPLHTYHIGADETPGAWVDSPSCQALLADNSLLHKTSAGLSNYFVERVMKELSSRGIQPAVWGDGLKGIPLESLSKNIQTNIWLPLAEHAHLQVSSYVNQGWQVVLSIPDVLYFDFPYEIDPKEPGLTWASRAINTRKVFEFMPGNLPAHSEVWADVMGQHFEADDRSLSCSAAPCIATGPIQLGKKVQGIQGNMWGELVRSPERANYQIYPRMLALAERAWHRPDWELDYNHEGAIYSQGRQYFSVQKQQQQSKDWFRFAQALAQKELPKLDIFGVEYRIPTVGAQWAEGLLHANTAFAGLLIEYRVGNGAWQNYSQPLADLAKQTVTFRALSSDRKRKGRAISVNLQTQ